VTGIVETVLVSTVAPVFVDTEEVKLDEVSVEEIEVARSSLLVEEVDAKDTVTSKSAVHV